MKLEKSFLKLALLILLFGLFSFLPQDVFSASKLVWSQAKWDISTNMDTFCMGGLIDTSNGKVIEFNWPSGFDLTGLAISDTSAQSEVEAYFGHMDCTGTARIAEATATPANDRDLVEIDGQMLRITLEDDTTGSFSFKFIDKTDVNTDTIVTPSSAGNYFMQIWEKQTAAGVPVISMGDFIYVGGVNEVNISASVDPTLTFELSDTSCTLGTMTPTDLKTCNYSTTVSTNAVGGYTSYIKADGTFRKGSDTITAVSDAAVTAGGNEYGVSTTNASATIGYLGGTHDASYCASLDSQHTYEAGVASALSTSDQSYAASTAPVDGEETTLCHSAGINASTPAGTYSQLVTLTVVGNF